MLLVKASAKPSKIDGIGLFADEKILKGTITWKFNPQFDLLFDPEELSAMPEQPREFIDKYSFLSKKLRKHVLSTDDSRFTNHSSRNNNIDSVDLGGPELSGVANRDIEIGEEILTNYRLFDSYDSSSGDEYLNE